MPALSDYTSGTITLTNNSTAFTGTGTGWQAAAFREGDTIFQVAGQTQWDAVIATITSNTAGTLVRPWGGATGTYAYRMRYMADGARVTAQARNLIELLGNGNLQALAGLTGPGVPVFNGPHSMTVKPETDFVTGVTPFWKDRITTDADAPAAKAGLKAVGYDGQSLTAPEKAQALLNLGAISNDADQSAQAMLSARKINILKNTLQAWEQIGPVISASGAAQVVWTDLADFRFLRARWDLLITGNTGGLFSQISITNGASWQNGAADYRYQGKSLTNGTQTYFVPTDGINMPMSGQVYGANWASGSIEFHAWNAPNALSPGRVYSNIQSPAGWHTSELDLINLFSGTKNAFRIYPIGGTMTGKFVLEGIRG